VKLPTIIILLWLITVFNCITAFAGDPSAASQNATAARQRQEDDIREAVFRCQFASNNTSTAEVFFLSIGEGKKGSDIFDASHDPSDNFTKRFVGLKVPVRKASASIFGRPQGWVVDKHSGKRGILFSVKTIKRVSDAEVQVEGSLTAGMLAAGGHTYTVKMEKGKWKVTKEESTWIS
jgi:hypothetical protein